MPASTRLKFWGVRGSIPVPGPSTLLYGGNTSCVELRADGELIILDAGTGIRALGNALAAEFLDTPVRASLLITHTHWDHIQGLPFFQPAYTPGNHLRIFGYEGATRGLGETLAGQMESSYFPVALKDMGAEIEIHELKEFVFRIGEVRVQAWTMNHPGLAVGYRLFTSGGSIAYLPDNEPCSNAAPVTPAHVIDADNQPLTDFVRDADALIVDAQYERADYHRHVGWGHGCVEDVVQIAAAAKVKRLFLFHHDPSHDDARIAAKAARAQELAKSLGSALIVEAAREGDEINLPA